VVERADRKAATPVRPLGMDDRLPEQPIDGTSGVKGDFHAPFCGSPGVRFPRATRRDKTKVLHSHGPPVRPG
jgi:hypothetical protein